MNKPKAETVYFQVYLERLITVQPPEPSYDSVSFAIFRGKQKIEATKSIEGPFEPNSPLELKGLRLNFVILHYTPDKREEFLLKINGSWGGQQTQIADFAIDCNRFVDEFKVSSNGAFEEELELGSHFKVFSDVFIQNTRFAVEKLVREAKGGRAKEGSIVFQQIRDKRKPRLTREESPYRSISRSKRDQFKRSAGVRKELASVQRPGPFQRSPVEDKAKSPKSGSREKKEKQSQSPPKTVQDYVAPDTEIKPAEPAPAVQVPPPKVQEPVEAPQKAAEPQAEPTPESQKQEAAVTEIQPQEAEPEKVEEEPAKVDNPIVTVQQVAQPQAAEVPAQNEKDQAAPEETQKPIQQIGQAANTQQNKPVAVQPPQPQPAQSQQVKPKSEEPVQKQDALQVKQQEVQNEVVSVPEQVQEEPKTVHQDNSKQIEAAVASVKEGEAAVQPTPPQDNNQFQTATEAIPQKVEQPMTQQMPVNPHQPIYTQEQPLLQQQPKPAEQSKQVIQDSPDVVQPTPEAPVASQPVDIIQSPPLAQEQAKPAEEMPPQPPQEQAQPVAEKEESFEATPGLAQVEVAPESNAQNPNKTAESNSPQQQQPEAGAEPGKEESSPKNTGVTVFSLKNKTIIGVVLLLIVVLSIMFDDDEQSSQATPQPTPEAAKPHKGKGKKKGKQPANAEEEVAEEQPAAQPEAEAEPETFGSRRRGRKGRRGKKRR